MTRIAVVGLGFPQLGLLRAARALGLTVVGLDKNPDAVGAKLANEVCVASTGDADAVADAVRRAGATALTTTGSELALTTTSEVAHRLGLPFYADPATVHRCQDKGAMRAAYESAGLRVPRFVATHDEAAGRAFFDALGAKVVVKPARGWGQRGVARVAEAGDFARAFAAAARASHDAAGVVVEECIEGPEVSVNGWMEGGRLRVFATTLREVFPGSAPLGVMRSEIAPSGLGDDVDRAAADAAERAALALGLRRGPCYTQVCVTRTGPVVFETAARCGGGFDADVARLVSGVDLYRRLLGIALGDAALEAEGPTSAPHGAALVRFLRPPTGRVARIAGLDAARAIPGVLDADAYVKPGDVLEGLVHAASRVGHVLATGTDRAAAVAAADAAEAAIRVEVGG